jgi:hypothetical protein
MFRGTEPPKMVYDSQVFNLPRPVKGGRKEEYEVLGKVYENIDGLKIAGEKKWRFKGAYEFPYNPTDNFKFVDAFVYAYNRTRTVKWVPHGDFIAIQYDVIIDKLSPEAHDGNVFFDKCIVEVSGVQPCYKIPSIDNMFGCFRTYNCCCSHINQ